MVKKKSTPKRHVIPIDFDVQIIDRIRALAEKEGMKPSTYARHLIVTHPKFKKG